MKKLSQNNQSQINQVELIDQIKELADQLVKLAETKEPIPADVKLGDEIVNVTLKINYDKL